MRNSRSISSRKYEEIHLKEKKERLLQTLLILMGLMIAGQSLNSNNESFPTSYYMIFFVFVLTTVFSYSNLFCPDFPKKLIVVVNLIVAASFSFVLVFFFAYNGAFPLLIGFLFLMYFVLTIVLYGALCDDIIIKKLEYSKFESIFYFLLIIFIIFYFCDIGINELMAKYDPAEPLFVIDINKILSLR